MSESHWSALFNASGCSHLDATLTDPESAVPPPDVTVLCPLPYRLVEVSGADAETFLQGQLTCHLTSVDPRRGTPGAQCSIKGRVLATFLVGQPGSQRYWLRLPADNAAATAQALAKYVVFSRATVALEPDAIVFGLYGPAAGELLRSVGADCDGQHGTASLDGGLVYQRDAAGLRYECWLPPAAATALLRALGSRLQPAAPSFWQLLDIRAGEATVDEATRDQFLPQMLNLDATGAVRFDKGCYTGQEVVARAHYRGQVKRRLRRFSCDGPAVGAAVEAENGQTVGSVIASAAASNGWELLAVVAESALEPLRNGTEPLRPEALPYAINEAKR